jgi:site-specific DNA-cytosine methylase
MNFTANAKATPKSELCDATPNEAWDTETIDILTKAKELYENAGRKVTKELKEFLRDAKAHFNRGPGNPHGRMSWKQFCEQLTGGSPCVKTIDNWIASLDDDLLTPIENESSENEAVPVIEDEPREANSEEETTEEVDAATQVIKKIKVKFLEVDPEDDGLSIKNLTQDSRNGSFTLTIKIPEYEGMVFGVTFDSPEDPRPVPEFLKILDKFARIWAPLGRPTYMTVFSGWGGVGDCFRRFGYQGVGGNEWDPEDKTQNAFQNLAHFFKDMHEKKVLLNKDIWKITREDLETIMSTYDLKPGYLDVFQMSPVCTGFSGKNRSKERLMEPDMIDRNDNVINLFKPAIEMVKVLLPKFVLLENVAGLCDKVSFPKLLEIVKTLEDAGYYVKWRVLKASDIGAPQTRPRLWMIGIRQDLNVMPTFPDAMKKRGCVKDVLPYVEFFRLEGVKTVTERIMDENGNMKTVVKKVIGRDGKIKSAIEPHPVRPSTFPCGTILKSAGVWLKDFGSDEWRHPTNEELLTLFTFPPELASEFIGSPDQVRERLGNSVMKVQVDALIAHIETLALSIPNPDEQHQLVA